MRILVTGAAGFIGSHAARIADEAGHEVTTLDGLRHAADPRRLGPGTHHYWDLRSPLPHWLIADIGEQDVVWHFAADSHVERSIVDPVPFVQGNVAATLHLLEACRRDRPSWSDSLLSETGYVVQISTDEIYGPSLIGHKEWDPILPSNPYAASKASQEAIAISYWRTFDVPLVITNTMNNYGVGQDSEKFVPKAIETLAAGRPMTVHGKRSSATQWLSGSRCWLPVEAHARALLAIHNNPVANQILGDLRYDPEAEESRPIRVNITGPQMSNARVIEMLAEALGFEGDPVTYVDFHGSRPGHDLHYALDPTLGEQIFDAPTREDVEDNLRELARSYRAP